jgi:hypothetical protein
VVVPQVGGSPTKYDRGNMSSTASLITVLAASAFGLIVVAIAVRVFGDRTP